jgi:hypothetical protein
MHVDLDQSQPAELSHDAPSIDGVVSHAGHAEVGAATGSPPKKWDLIIRAKTGWFDLHLAYLWRYRDLTMLFVWRDFVSQYKQTILVLWQSLIFWVAPDATVTESQFGHVPPRSLRLLPKLLFHNLAPVHCWLYPTVLVRQAGGFNEALRSHEDWDL